MEAKDLSQVVRSQSSLIVSIHALVIMNTSDHCNRAKYIDPKLTRVFGILLGKQEGKVLELNNTVEITYKVNKGQIELDEVFIKKRLDAYKKMFPNLDCVGWYSTGVDQKTDYPLENDLKIQNGIKRYCENPVYMIMNTESKAAAEKKQIPIFMYETNHQAHRFELLEWQLAQSEDERIAVDNVAKAIDTDAAKSTVSTNLTAAVNAIKVLRRKILHLISIFEKSNEVCQNPEYSRRLNQICQQVKSLDAHLKKNENYMQADLQSDVVTINLLSTATKGFAALQELVKEFNVINKGNKMDYDRPFGGGNQHLMNNPMDF